MCKVIYFCHIHLNIYILFMYFNDAGFTSDKVEIMKACCGGSGPYHVDEKFCGGPGTTVCPDPSKLINWDGNHLTEAAYKLVAK
jgi:hypothetical protein